MGWKGHPVVEIRLTQEINIDSLPPNFEFTVQDGNKDGPKYYCEVSGVRIEGHDQVEREENPDDPWTRWVTIEGTGYAQKEDIISDWLLRYGEFVNIGEIIRCDADKGYGLPCR